MQGFRSPASSLRPTSPRVTPLSGHLRAVAVFRSSRSRVAASSLAAYLLAAACSSSPKARSPAAISHPRPCHASPTDLAAPIESTAPGKASSIAAPSLPPGFTSVNWPAASWAACPAWRIDPITTPYPLRIGPSPEFPCAVCCHSPSAIEHNYVIAEVGAPQEPRTVRRWRSDCPAQRRLGALRPRSWGGTVTPVDEFRVVRKS